MHTAVCLCLSSPIFFFSTFLTSLSQYFLFQWSKLALFRLRLSNHYVALLSVQIISSYSAKFTHFLFLLPVIIRMNIAERETGRSPIFHIPANFLPPQNLFVLFDILCYLIFTSNNWSIRLDWLVWSKNCLSQVWGVTVFILHTIRLISLDFRPLVGQVKRSEDINFGVGMAHWCLMNFCRFLVQMLNQLTKNIFS